MEKSDVIAVVKQLIPDAQVEVEGADCSFALVVISESFGGQLAVKRQQQVLAGFSDLLGAGVLHALTVKPYTPEEWQRLQQQNLTQLLI